MTTAIGNILTRKQRYGLLAFTNCLWMSTFSIMRITYDIDHPQSVDCVERAIDFHALWGAARLAYAGEALAAFDHQSLLAAFNSCPRSDMFWLYPAPAMTMLTPFGGMPFLAGYIALNVLSLTLVALAARQFLQNDLFGLALIVFAPAWLPALLSGQLTLLWCAGLLTSIALLRQERNITAGIVIGLLTIKPTLGLLIPIVLLADRRYATIVSAIITTLVIHVCATALYGFEYVTLWMDVAFGQSAIERSDVANSPGLSSFGAFTTLFGLPPAFSIYPNIAISVALAVVLFLTWRKHGAQSDMACAALCAAIPLATPYLWHYDAAFSALTALFLYRSRPPDTPTYYWLLLVAFWFGPGISVVNRTFFHIPWIYGTAILSPILIVAFLFSLMQLSASQKTHAS